MRTKIRLGLKAPERPLLDLQKRTAFIESQYPVQSQRRLAVSHERAPPGWRLPKAESAKNTEQTWTPHGIGALGLAILFILCSHACRSEENTSELHSLMRISYP